MQRVVLPAVVLTLLLAVVLILASALGRPAPPPLEAGAVRVEQVDTGAYPEITLYVSVTDEAGNPRTALRSEEFALTEDGVRVEIAAFGGAGVGSIASVLVVDRSGSMDEDRKMDGAREAASAFVELLRPGDQAAIVAFNDDVELVQDFTDDQAELEQAIAQLRPDSGTAIYDSIVAAVDLLRNVPGRRLLVVLSDGQDSRESDEPQDHEYGSVRTLDEAIAYARAAGQPIALVGVGNRLSDGDDGIDEQVLLQIAEATGGRYFYAPQADELAGLYTGLAGDVQREYRLTYVSPRPFYDGTRRDIQVQVGAVAATGGYTERHLINVVANPLVGLLLLAPLAGLLVLPGGLAARRRQRGGATLQVAIAEPPASMSGATKAAPAMAVPVSMPLSAQPTLAPLGRRCSACDTQLRPNARYCATCGAAQPGEGAGALER